jgi:hypothetical protein
VNISTRLIGSSNNDTSLTDTENKKISSVSEDEPPERGDEEMGLFSSI